jgi:hypothetical protein
MERLDGLDGESVALEGDYLESLKDGVSRTRLPLWDWRSTDVRPISRRKIPLVGPKREYLQVIFKFDVWVALIVPIEQRPAVHRFMRRLEKQRAAR